MLNCLKVILLSRMEVIQMFSIKDFIIGFLLGGIVVLTILTIVAFKTKDNPIKTENLSKKKTK